MPTLGTEIWGGLRMLMPALLIKLSSRPKRFRNDRFMTVLQESNDEMAAGRRLRWLPSGQTGAGQAIDTAPVSKSPGTPYDPAFIAGRLDAVLLCTFSMIQSVLPLPGVVLKSLGRGLPVGAKQNLKVSPSSS